MQRRDFIAGLGAAVAWPLAAHGQQPGQMKRVGLLTFLREPVSQPSLNVLKQGLQAAGWTEGRNVRFEVRFVGSNDPNLARRYAAELVGLAPDLIATDAAPFVDVLRRLTRTIPIVFDITGDPVQAGFVQSLAQPGGNLTGVFQFEPAFNTKYLQLLKDIAPQLSRVAVLQSEASSWRGDFAAIEAVAASFSVAPSAMIVRDDPADIERVIADFAREPDGGLILPSDAMTAKHRQLIITLAAKNHLPAIYNSRSYVDAGGLMYYGSGSFADSYRRLAPYLDRVLRGTRPADLPVQAPTRFELVINLKTATALGLKIPPSLFALADEVIE
jgi:putative tryptophan/tyrosine transport system substrate-binding protein